MSSNNGVANGHRTTAIPQLDDLPTPTDTLEERNARGAATLIGKRTPSPLDGPFKTPVTDALRAANFGPMTEEGMARLAAEQAATDRCEPTPAPLHWADELRQWWNGTADRDISSSLDKIVEYGGSGPAYDLLATGHDLAAMNGRRVTDEEAVELAVMMYLSSKVNRWLAAAKDGRRPSDDTLLDIVYYGMMARRNRAVGGWPTA